MTFRQTAINPKPIQIAGLLVAVMFNVGLARAAENGGASHLTVHCRSRAERYSDTADWRRLERAAGAVSIPVCGNGG